MKLGHECGIMLWGIEELLQLHYFGVIGFEDFFQLIVLQNQLLDDLILVIAHLTTLLETEVILRGSLLLNYGDVNTVQGNQKFRARVGIEFDVSTHFGCGAEFMIVNLVPIDTVDLGGLKSI